MDNRGEKILILDFGGEYTQHVARKIRALGVFSEIMPYHLGLEKIKDAGAQGIVFTGGPHSVHDADAPRISGEVFKLGIPVLGICYGMQLMADILGGATASAENRDYTRTCVELDEASPLFHELPGEAFFSMARGDVISALPEGFAPCAHDEQGAVAAIADTQRGLYAVQFHPEADESGAGETILRNFVYGICGCAGDWNMKQFVEEAIESIRRTVGDGKALCALSGGVDSSVCAALVHRAIGHNQTCIFVDTGLMRKDEGDQVCADFGEKFGLNLIRVDAEDRFLARLKGVTDPEAKRKIIGEEFIRVFEEEARKIGQVDFLVQGTIYPDVLESGLGHTGTIKSHHNVGGLPDVVDFRAIIEPVKDLFKDEVRAAGMELGMPYDMVWRQPFPGPGLSVRCIGEVTKEKLDILREADAIFREEIISAGLHRDIWQYFAILTQELTTGVKNDARTYDRLIALRAVYSIDAMTADWARIDYDLLAQVSNRIINEVEHVNRVVYDITAKPPGTIEWE